MDDKKFIKTVLAYYEVCGRNNLTWRKAISPYKILVSEIMLQQTQVTRVTPKFSEWMKRYPSLSALSRANLSEVLKLWQGLGYQRRAKSLLEISKQVAILPKTYAELLRLPGIGPYTASAILAFAHNVFPERLLETNIRTALIEAFHLPAQAGQGENSIHDGVLYDDLSRLTKNRTVQSVGARTWYYALMDYGAHLKTLQISHNEKSAHHTKQSPYEGSVRQLRARILFAITHKEKLPEDERSSDILDQLTKEGYIVRKGNGYRIK